MKLDRIRGKALIYGDHVNTDVIFPGKYTYTVKDPSEMASHAMEDLDPNFPSRAREGAVLLVGKNFGCGSSREQAVLCLKEAGVRAILARSFARIYYRNAINLGLPAIKLDWPEDFALEGDEISIDLEMGVAENLSRGGFLSFPPFPAHLREILEAGGLVPYTRRKVVRRT